MGQVLPHPVQSQLLQRKGNKLYRVGTGSMHGFRVSMEDTHVVIPSLNERFPEVAMFGVFDGHSGEAAALFLEEELPQRISQLEDPTNEEQLSKCVQQLDADFCKNAKLRGQGSTCTFCIVLPSKEKKGHFEVIAVNVGDSRSFLVHTDGTIQSLTEDHKPDLAGEEARIRAAGGFVHVGRVDGQLAMSRAIGDWGYKSNPNLAPDQQKVIAVPQITRNIAAPSDVLVICCDGLVEQMSSEEAGKRVRENLVAQRTETKQEDLAQACYDLNLLSLAKNSKDNHSVMAIAFEDGTSYQRDDEFVAGPYHAYKDEQLFVDAYIADAKKHGYEGERLFELARKTEANLPVTALQPTSQASPSVVQMLNNLMAGGGLGVMDQSSDF
jgi:protein phosphatase 2C family protein 2/3